MLRGHAREGGGGGGWTGGRGEEGGLFPGLFVPSSKLGSRCFRERVAGAERRALSRVPVSHSPACYSLHK